MFTSRSAEVDPLLPQNEPSPEIQGYGTTRNFRGGSSEIRYNDPPTYKHYENDDDDNKHKTTYIVPSLQPPPSQQQSPVDVDTRPSAWSSVVVFVTFAVFFALVYMSLGGHESLTKPQPDPIPVPDKPHRLPLDERVKKILTNTPLIDGHDDLAISIRAAYQNDIHSKSFKDGFENGKAKGDVDLVRLKKGMYGGAFWSAFVPCPEHASEDFSDAEYSTSVSTTLQQIDLIKRLQKLYPDHFSLAGTSLEDMLARFHASQTMLGPISLEGLHQVPQSSAMSTLRLYYELGVRAATLTWNCHNAFADAALISSNGTTKLAPYHRGGLTPLGRDVIREMNRLGMLVDISHTSYWTQKAVLTGETSLAPVIFSHSSAWSLCPHPRNVKDDILDMVKEKNSVVMVNFAPDFISCEASDGDLPDFYPKNNTLHQAARHIVYIGEKIGYDHVGLGSDFDGIGTLLPEGLDGVDKFPDLVKELLNMGVSDSDASKIVGGNVLRVWKAAEKVAQTMQHDGVREGEDHVAKMWSPDFF